MHVKVKGKGLDTYYSAAYMSQTRDHQCFTFSEVAADLHEPMVQLADTLSPQLATLGLHPIAIATTHFPSR